MSRIKHLTEKERVLLSAYLDGELTVKERAQVSALLAVSPDAARQLEALRNVRSVLRLLPARKVPHHFTLTRLEAQAAKPGRVFNLMRVISGISAAALAAVLAFDFLVPIRAVPMSVRMAEDLAIEEMPAAEIALAPKEKGQPYMFNWYPASPYGYGIGGGGGGDGAPFIPQGPVLPDISLQPGETSSEVADAAGQEEMLESAPAPLALETEAGTADEKQAANSGPILGVRPADQQGQTFSGELIHPQADQLPPEPETRLPYRMIEIALLTISFMSALAAILLRKRKRMS